jgi:hypothetical protein
LRHKGEQRVRFGNDGKGLMMRKAIIGRPSLAALTLMATVEPAWAEAKPVSIEGNAWVAILLALVFIFVVYLVIIGSLGVERRDAQLGRREDHEHGWFGHPGKPRDDDDNGSSNGNS